AQNEEIRTVRHETADLYPLAEQKDRWQPVFRRERYDPRPVGKGRRTRYEDRARLVPRHRRKNVLELVGTAQVDGLNSYPQRPRHPFCFAQGRCREWVGRVPQQGYAGEIRNACREELQLLADERHLRNPTQAGDIPTGPRGWRRDRPEPDRRTQS